MKFDCEFETQDFYNNGSMFGLYTCQVNNALITTAGDKISDFLGGHVSGYTNIDVEAINFTGIVDFFPRRMHEIFPKLKVVQINHCGLKEISSDDLEGLENLESLYLKDNKLHSLPTDLLAGCLKLNTISFCGNMLEFISPKLLDPVKESLCHADFQQNLAIDGIFDRNVETSCNTIDDLMALIALKCEPPRKNFGFYRKFGSHLKDLWLSGDYADFVIVCGAKEFKVHQFVLGGQSSFFATKFRNEPNDKRMKIDGYSDKIVETMLAYMYTGEFDEDCNAMVLYDIAFIYRVLDLISNLQEEILDKIDMSNALEIYQLGCTFHSDEMVQKSFKFIKKSITQIKIDESLMYDKLIVEKIVFCFRKAQIEMENIVKERKIVKVQK